MSSAQTDTVTDLEVFVGRRARQDGREDVLLALELLRHPDVPAAAADVARRSLAKLWSDHPLYRPEWRP
jgi:hypothetical protein